MKIGVLRERRAGEKRVAATPDSAKRLAALGLEVVVERGAGDAAGIGDAAFEKAGAAIGDLDAVIAADILLSVRGLESEERASLRAGQILIGALDPHQEKDALAAYAQQGATAFSLELLPRTTRAQAMDILSSQANLAGYRAVIDAMSSYNKVMPMMMTAAGTVTPAKVFVVGAGVAGLQAIATARRMGAVVSATDVRPAAKQEVESLGAKFVGFVPEDAATSGGYARALTPEEQAKQAEMVADHIKGQDIVVTTAQIPGRRAPKIVSGAMVASMKSGAVLLDLAAESGGNVEGAQAGVDVFTENGAIISGAKDMLSKMAPASSALYAKNLLNFVTLLVDKEKKAIVVDEEDDLIKGAMITKDGAVVHPALKAD